jgi:hypothetical protein
MNLNSRKVVKHLEVVKHREAIIIKHPEVKKLQGTGIKWVGQVRRKIRY